MVKTYSAFFITFIFSLLAGFALLHPGIFPTHDGEYHIIRFYEFDKSFHEGVLYPRWAKDLNFGFGLPQLNFYYPLPHYLASFFHVFGVSFIDGLKLNMFCATVSGGVFMYLLSKEFWGKTGGVISSILYTFSPYHFLDMYIRGAVGEVWFLGLFPGFLFMLTKLVQTRNILYFSLSSIFLALVIFSHNSLVLACMAFSLPYSLIVLILNRKKWKDYAIVGSVFILGILLSSIFWLPAIAESQYTRGLQGFDLERNFADLSELLIPSWGSGFFGTSLANQMSVQIGVANLLSFFIGIFFAIILSQKKDRRYLLILFLFFWFILTVFLMLSFSILIWRVIPLLHYFQFPWRLLSITILVCALLGGTVSVVKKSFFIAFFFVLFTLVTTYTYAKPDHYFYRNDRYYISRSNFIDGTNSPGNSFNTIWESNITAREKNKIEISEGKGKLLKKKELGTSYQFVLSSITKTVITVNTLYFPGWKAFIDGKEKHIRILTNGSMAMNIPEGRHTIQIMFLDTPVRIFAECLSFFSFLVLLTLLLKTWYSKKKL
jgi:uncharacterized membrane protein